MEIYKIIIESNGKYSVSNFGKVRRNRSERIDKWNRKRITKEKIIKPAIIGKGYLDVTLRIDRKSLSRYVHRLVAVEFLTNKDNLPEVNHKDLNKLNNKVENLEWISKRDNANHWINSENVGTTFVKKLNKYLVRIMVNGKREYLGYFDKLEDAKEKYNERASQV